jgi:hypothetical protein
MTQTIGSVTVTQKGVDTYTVKAGAKRAKTFKGESAWCDAERYANDELTVERGPFGERFVL